MLFRLLLWVLGWRLHWLSRRHPAFQALLQGKDRRVIQFQTFNGRIARHFWVDDMRFRSRAGTHEQPAMTLAFEDARYAVDTLMGAGRNPMVFMQGVQAQRIRMAGDGMLMMWFVGLVKFLPPARKSKGSPDSEKK
jgi:hypothetical protein